MSRAACTPRGRGKHTLPPPSAAGVELPAAAAAACPCACSPSCASRRRYACTYRLLHCRCSLKLLGRSARRSCSTAVTAYRHAFLHREDRCVCGCCPGSGEDPAAATPDPELDAAGLAAATAAAAAAAPSSPVASLSSAPDGAAASAASHVGPAASACPPSWPLETLPAPAPEATPAPSTATMSACALAPGSHGAASTVLRRAAFGLTGGPPSSAAPLAPAPSGTVASSWAPPAPSSAIHDPWLARPRTAAA